MNTTDQLIARNNPTNIGNVVRFLTLGNPPAAPEVGGTAGEDRSSGTIASALALRSLDAQLRRAVQRLRALDRIEHADLSARVAAIGPVASATQTLRPRPWPNWPMKLRDHAKSMRICSAELSADALSDCVRLPVERSGFAYVSGPIPQP